MAVLHLCETRVFRWKTNDIISLRNQVADPEEKRAGWKRKKTIDKLSSIIN